MCSEFFFYIKLIGPLTTNLGSRLSNEMADLGANFKQKMFKTISFRFPSSAVRTDDRLDIIAEEAISTSDVRQRPLPLVPEIPKERPEKMPWFKAIDRGTAEELLKGNEQPGVFIVRPSSKSTESWAITLWYGGRPYNLPIRHRLDGRFALGTYKELEQSFPSIEEMIDFYRREEIILYSGGTETGRTTLRS